MKEEASTVIRRQSSERPGKGVQISVFGRVGLEMVAVPLMKLFSLTVKTLAKPVAKRIKSGETDKVLAAWRTNRLQYLY